MLKLWEYFLHGEDIGARFTMALTAFGTAFGAVHQAGGGEVPKDAGTWILLLISTLAAFGSKKTNGDSIHVEVKP